ncbi:hypothetical protein EBB59_08220 [Lysobacter pythonis]|uniref:Uncharacterized protein n=1 Tax=Solilutibacter pythonis TaxID=2483112 RepID=A0A3M2HQ25_9GAMM|nr:hypothetical protein [Lysobacter pythonis]RMH91118.1 hypothetical protein EBB59_08220 [Lysobacter pythonis]
MEIFFAAPRQRAQRDECGDQTHFVSARLSRPSPGKWPWFAGDKIAAWTDDHRIYRQDDRQGNTWTYDPDQPALGWQREAPIDASNDHIDNPTRGRLRASPALANELNHQATRTSVERVLGSPPSQRDPFTQPALANDAPSITPANWVRDADGDTWRREVVVAYLEHGLRQTRIDAAGPEHAAELDRAAAQTVLPSTGSLGLALDSQKETPLRQVCNAFHRITAPDRGAGWPVPYVGRHCTDLERL